MSQLSVTKQNIYTRQGLWSLFLVCAFPLHLWTLILAFQDVEWVTERTNAWDAVGVIAYGMLFALMESLIIFLIVALLGFLTPKHWNADKRIAFLSLLFLIAALWGMMGQLFFLWHINLPAQIIHILARTEHPLRWLYAGSLAIVIPTVTLPVYSFMHSDKVFLFMQELISRLTLLTTLYLFFDALGLILVVIRNI